MPHSLEAAIRHIVRRIRRQRAKHVLLGPAVLDAEDRPYFVMVSGNRNTGHCHIERVKAPEWDFAKAVRGSLTLALATTQPPLVIHDFDDELALARLGEALWPERFKPIRAAIEAERTTKH